MEALPSLLRPHRLFRVLVVFVNTLPPVATLPGEHATPIGKSIDKLSCVYLAGGEVLAALPIGHAIYQITFVYVTVCKAEFPLAVWKVALPFAVVGLPVFPGVDALAVRHSGTELAHIVGRVAESGIAVSKIELPMTIDGAVRLMVGLVPEDEQARIVCMSADDLPGLHMASGKWVRNHLGQWGGNTALLAATGEENADDASAALVRAFWRQLRDKLPKVTKLTCKQAVTT